MTRPPGLDDGFALVTALWAALILALVVSFVLKAGRTDARIAHTAVQQAELRALAQGAVVMTELRLLAPLGAPGLSLDGTPTSMIYAGHQVQIRVQDQAGLIDLNFASEDILNRLFEAAGVAKMDAQVLTDRIMDWREKGVGRRLNGAKAPDYAAAGFAYGPREGAFESVAELKLVMGMTACVYERVAPALTVYSQKPVIEVQLAPKAVLIALPGMKANGIAEEMARREQARSSQSGILSTPSFSGGRSVEVKADVTGQSGQSASWSATLRAIGEVAVPLLVYRSD